MSVIMRVYRKRLDSENYGLLEILTNYLKTFNTRIVAGELTTDSFLLSDFVSGGSSRGLLDAEVAIANAAAAVDVLLLKTD